MTILETRDLRKVYGAGDTEVRALDGVHLTVEKGEFVAVVGTSGSGKSTLLHMLGGLDRPTSGSVTVDGREIFQLKDEELTIFRRRKIGFVFQNYNLVPVLNVYENIVLPIRLDGKVEDRAYVEQIRGVDSSYTVGLLLDRHLIEECGRLQVPGRPRLYRTTKAFLRAFHLNSLEDLPEMPGMEADGQLRLAEDGSVLDNANA